MKEDQFILENSDTWNRLEYTLYKLKSKGMQKFEKSELDDFLTLYNSACSHLSYSRTYYADSRTTSYLNRLVASAHGYIYTVKPYSLRKLMLFFHKDFPLLLKNNISYFWVSFSAFMLGFVISFILTLLNADNAIAFLPEDFVNRVNFSDPGSVLWDGSIMSSIILTNNIKVGLTALALGITLGIGTIWVLIKNGFMLGSIAALASHNSSNLIFWSMILPHGILELFAIFVCGAAGLIIGYSIINPGNFSRKDSLILRSKSAIKLVCWTIPVFVIAGLIEGFITPAPLSVEFKYIFSLVTLSVLLIYLTVSLRANR